MPVGDPPESTLAVSIRLTPASRHRSTCRRASSTPVEPTLAEPTRAAEVIVPWSGPRPQAGRHTHRTDPLVRELEALTMAELTQLVRWADDAVKQVT
jgi:hypothetical protein